MKRHRFLSIILSVLVLSFSSCGDKKETNDSGNEGNGKVASKGTIGMTCMDLNNPFFRLIADVMEKEAAKAGYKVIALSGENNPVLQITQMRDFVAQECDAIFLHPADSSAVADGIKHAYEKGTPVFTFDMEMDSEEVRKMVTAHIGSDNFQGGELAGESMMKVTGGKGKIGIINLPTAGSCVKRVDGFKKYLADNGSELSIVSELNGMGKVDQGYKVANDMLSANPDIIAIFCINDPCALGAYRAVQEQEKTDEITVIGFDGSPKGKKGVFEKKLYDSPQQFPRKMAIETVENFLRHQKGDEIEKSVFLPCKHYFYEDAANDKNRDGWGE
jgi:ribose transport system substrate-binding protein